MLLSYALVRANATDNADRDVKAFFRDFALADSTFVDKQFRYLAQPREVVEAIISRHSSAIMNFRSSKHAPDLNVMLNRTVVAVSWHLTIVFAKRSDGWYVESFDEFVAKPNNA